MLWGPAPPPPPFRPIGDGEGIAGLPGLVRSPLAAAAAAFVNIVPPRAGDRPTDPAGLAALQHRKQRHQSLAEWQQERKERQCRLCLTAVGLRMACPAATGPATPGRRREGCPAAEPARLCCGPVAVPR